MHLGTDALGEREEVLGVNGLLDLAETGVVLAVVALLPVGERVGDVVDIVAGHEGRDSSEEIIDP